MCLIIIYPKSDFTVNFKIKKIWVCAFSIFARNWLCYIDLLKLNFMVTTITFETLCNIKVASPSTFTTVVNGNLTTILWDMISTLSLNGVFTSWERFGLKWHFFWNCHFCIESVCLKIYLLSVSLFLWSIWFQISVPK